VYSVLV